MKKVCVVLVIFILSLSITNVFAAEEMKDSSDLSKKVIKDIYQNRISVLGVGWISLYFNIEIDNEYYSEGETGNLRYNLYCWEEGQTIEDKVLNSTFYGYVNNITFFIEELKLNTKYYYYLDVAGYKGDIMTFETPMQFPYSMHYIQPLKADNIDFSDIEVDDNDFSDLGLEVEVTKNMYSDGAVVHIKLTNPLDIPISSWKYRAIMGDGISIDDLWGVDKDYFEEYLVLSSRDWSYEILPGESVYVGIVLKGKGAGETFEIIN